MTTKQFKLTEAPKLKELLLTNSQFDIPKVFKIDFSTARPKYRYDNNGKTDTIESYVLSGVDDKIYSNLESLGMSMADIKTIPIEVTSDYAKIEDAIDNQSIASVELTNVTVKLQWVDGSKNAGYKALKLVASGLKLIK